MTDPNNPLVEYEILDADTGDVIGRGTTRKSTVDYLAAGGQTVRIIEVLTPGALAIEPEIQE